MEKCVTTAAASPVNRSTPREGRDPHMTTRTTRLKSITAATVTAAVVAGSVVAATPADATPLYDNTPLGSFF